jgi:hypothetical protein
MLLPSHPQFVLPHAVLSVMVPPSAGRSDGFISTCWSLAMAAGSTVLSFRLSRRWGQVAVAACATTLRCTP